MKVGPFQTLALVDCDQLRGKILVMPDGDLSGYYLAEIIEEKKHREGTDRIGCKVLVSKDKVIKYTKKSEGEKSELQVIFDQLDVVAQFKNPGEEKVFEFSCCYMDSLKDKPEDKEADKPEDRVSG